MSYSQQASAVAQQMVRAADRPTRILAILNMIQKLDVGAEVTDDADGTLIYIPKVPNK